MGNGRVQCSLPKCYQKANESYWLLPSLPLPEVFAAFFTPQRKAKTWLIFSYYWWENIGWLPPRILPLFLRWNTRTSYSPWKKDKTKKAGSEAEGNSVLPATQHNEFLHFSRRITSNWVKAFYCTPVIRIGSKEGYLIFFIMLFIFYFLNSNRSMSGGPFPLSLHYKSCPLLSQIWKIYIYIKWVVICKDWSAFLKVKYLYD